MTDLVERRVTYTTNVESAWKATTQSPLSGKEIVCYGDEIEDVRRAVDIEIVKESHEAGLTVVGRFDPATGT